MRCRLLPAVALAVFLLATGVSAAASSSGVTNFYRVTYQNATSPADAARYQFMALGYAASASSQASMRSLIASIHRADPHTRILLYKNTAVGPNDPQGINGCASWNSAQPYGGIPSSWLLRSANGAPVYDTQYSEYELDPGNPQVQQACLSNAASMAKAGGYDGVFWDSVSTSLFWAGAWMANCASPSCQSDANWHAAIGSFVTNVSAGLHAQKLLAMANISGGAVNGVGGGPAWWQAFQQDGLDGAEEESFTSGNNHVPVPLAQWTLGLANEAWNEAHGKYFLANADVTSNQTLNTYGLATMLLAAQGRSSWDTASGDYGAGEYWFPVYNTALKLGQPLGAYGVQVNGLYARFFHNGTVVVNPTSRRIVDPIYGAIGAQNGLVIPGPPKPVPPGTFGPPPTGTPTGSGAPGHQKPAKRPKRSGPRLSGVTYVGRGLGLRVIRGQTSFFLASARNPSGTHPLSYHWAWGDGTRGCVGVPAWSCGGSTMGHTYRRAGRYKVTVTVTNGSGQSASEGVRIVVAPPLAGTVFSTARALGGSVATRVLSGGSVGSTLRLVGSASSVTAVTTVARCAPRRACIARVRTPVLAHVVDHTPAAFVLRFNVGVTNQPLLRAIRSALRAAHAHTLPATYTLTVTLATGRTVRIVQHLRLRF